jgi:hypothetical protein
MSAAETRQHLDFGVILNDILSHLCTKRKFLYPIKLAAIDHVGQMMLQSLTMKDGLQAVHVHYPASGMWLMLPAHILFVDKQGQSVKATIFDTDTGA